MAINVTLDIFKQGGGKSTANEFGVPFLGELPFDPGFVRGGDDGASHCHEPEGASAIAFAKVVELSNLKSGRQKVKDWKLSEAISCQKCQN